MKKTARNTKNTATKKIPRFILCVISETPFIRFAFAKVKRMRAYAMRFIRSWTQLITKTIPRADRSIFWAVIGQSKKRAFVTKNVKNDWKFSVSYGILIGKLPEGRLKRNVTKTQRQHNTYPAFDFGHRHYCECFYFRYGQSLDHAPRRTKSAHGGANAPGGRDGAKRRRGAAEDP